LRLAERKGLLSGSTTNIVQDFGLDLLMMWEDKDTVEKEVQQFKKMLGAANPQLIKTLWPDSFKQNENESGKVEYSRSMDKEEGLRLAQEIRNKKMSASLEELEEAGWM
jgi:hypothetical protein